MQMGRRSSKIAMRKGVQDAKKAKSWGKFGKLILQAAKAGGPSPEANVRLGEVCLGWQCFNIACVANCVFACQGLWAREQASRVAAQRAERKRCRC